MISLNFKVLSNWKETFLVAFSQLRRVKFIVEDSFSFGDFAFKLDLNGMVNTGSDLKVYRCRHLKIFKMLWLSVDFQLTLGAPFSTTLLLTLPPGCTAPIKTTGAGQFILTYNNAVAGNAILADGKNVIALSRSANAAYSAAPWRIAFNGFYEVA